ncbi:MAG: UDP-N-acetylmuramoyl-L-alanyl-D-glutamate--2,6-diaminopimelate ligase [Phycisphaerales bacterium]
MPGPISELLESLPELETYPAPGRLTPGTPPITGSTIDSRRLCEGFILVIDGCDSEEARRRALSAAEQRAAAVVLGSEAPDIARDVAASVAAHRNPVNVLVTKDPRACGGRVASWIAGDPSHRLDVVAVTGTNGKSTVAWLVQHLLGQAERVGFIGTVHVDDGTSVVPAGLTTPDPHDLAPILSTMVANGCTAVALEASSHGLTQGRLAGTRVSTAIFTNLTGDHLDYHGTMDAYGEAKAKLFADLDPSGTAIVNADDARADMMLDAAPASASRVRVSAVDDDADVRVTLRHAGLEGSEIDLRGPWGEHSIRVPLVGEHNAMNIAQAAAAAWSIGMASHTLDAAMKAATAPPGRLEPIGGGGPAVFVDYAHTDDALDSVLAALRPLTPASGRLIVVFGCGGDRDRTKRSRMAAAVARHAQVAIVTSDNPRSEPPESIIDDVMPGFAGEPIEMHRNADRRAAIKLAIDVAEPADVVVIAGKGHEDYQEIAGVRRVFDDRVVAGETLRARGRPADAAETETSEAGR